MGHNLDTEAKKTKLLNKKLLDVTSVPSSMDKVS